MTLIAVHTTVATRADADRLAQAAVRERLAACAQIEAIDSVYIWQGTLQQEPELRLLFKTMQDRQAALIARLRELHPYELPAIYSMAVCDATPDYAGWVRANTREGG